MKEKLIELVGNSLDDMKIVIDSVYEEKEEGNRYLRVVIDSDEILDLEKVVKATKVIDPIIEKADFINGEYILDVYAKPKGDK